jgi:hypothetical protein
MGQACSLGWVKRRLSTEYKVLGLCGGDCEECRLLECDTLWLKLEPMFRSKVCLNLQGEKNPRDRKNVNNN